MLTSMRLEQGPGQAQQTKHYPQVANHANHIRHTTFGINQEMELHGSNSCGNSHQRCLDKDCLFEKWFGANRHMFTPLLVADVHFCPKRSVFADFLHPPAPLARRGVLAPFPHPFCTLCAPFVHPPFCARTPFLHPFCTPFVRWNPLSAPFLRRGFCAKDFCKKGTKHIHQVPIWLLKRTHSAFFFGPLWPRQGQAFAGPLGVVTPRQGSPCSTHG